MPPLTRSLSWPRLCLGALVTLALSLSVHAVMIQGLNIPFPANFPRSGWPRLPDAALSVLAAIVLARHLPAALRRRNLASRAALLFLLLATIHEALFRAPFMEFVNHVNITPYPFLDNLPRLLPLVVTAVAVELYVSHTRANPLRSILVAAAIAAFNVLLLDPLLAHLFIPLLQFTAAREGDARYGLPYDWHILLPAYLTFIEPVVAALAIGLAIRDQLPPPHRLALTTCLIIALKGPVFAPFLNIHFAPLPPVLAFLSYAQFSFETIALGLLTALTLAFSLRRPPPASDPRQHSPAASA